MKKMLSALLAAMLAFSGAALADGADVPELIEPVGVKLDTAEVERQDLYQLKYYDASVVPYVEELAFTVDGQIETMEVLVGDMVKAGDVLATLNQDALEEQVESLRERIEYAETELAFAKRDDQIALAMAQLELDRMRGQAAAGEVSQDAVKLRQADVDILRAGQRQARELDEFEINSLKRQLESAESELGSNVIVAPFDGRIVYMNDVEKGNWVKAYDSMFFIADDTRLSIDSAYISTSTLENANALYARVGGVDYDLTPRKFNWREYVAIALSGGELRTDFDFADGAPDCLESGMYAAVFVKSGLVEDALTIPANALYSDGNGRYVYKIEGDTRVRTAVTTGRATTTSVQITDGLEEGDLVYVKE